MANLPRNLGGTFSVTTTRKLISDSMPDVAVAFWIRNGWRYGFRRGLGRLDTTSGQHIVDQGNDPSKQLARSKQIPAGQSHFALGRLRRLCGYAKSQGDRR